MVDVFGHEKLKVYEKSLAFVTMRSELLERVSRRVVACDHLDRASESILLNIAHASSSWSPKDRIVYMGHANGSALECAACLDVLVAKVLLTVSDIQAGKSLLREIVSMLIAMKRSTSNRVREGNPAEYSTKGDKFFSHEDLEVYQTALLFTGWVEDVSKYFSCSADLRAKLDKASTGIVLNIAEGNGRFSETDQARFLGVAYKATIQSASLVDLAVAGITSSLAVNRVQDGREMLQRIAAMLTSLAKTVPKYT